MTCYESLVRKEYISRSRISFVIFFENFIFENEKKFLISEFGELLILELLIVVRIESFAQHDDRRLKVI